MSEFKAELRRDILCTLNLEPKSPYTKHTIDFLANFLRSFSVEKEAPKQSETNESEGDTTLIDEDMTADNSAINRSDQENRCPEDEECDELGMETLGSDSFSRSKSETTIADTTTANDSAEEPTFADVIIKEQLIHFLLNKKTAIRYNCCLLIRKLFSEIEDMDLNVYNKLKKVSFGFVLQI